MNYADSFSLFPFELAVICFEHPVMASRVVDEIARRMQVWVEENIDFRAAPQFDTELQRDRDDDVLMADATTEDDGQMNPSTCSRDCGLAMLPGEIIHCIADHLATRDLVNFACACRGFYTLLRSTLHREVHRVALARPKDYDLFMNYSKRPPMLRHYSWNGKPLGPDPGMFIDAISFGRPRAVQSFLEHGVDPNSHDLYGNRALHVALSASFQREITHLLLKFGANPSMSDVCDSDSTPLYNASILADSEIARWFIEKGADVTQPNVIHALAQFCSAKTFRMAVAKGANIHEIDGAGGNIMHSAVRNEDWRIVEFLLDEKGMGHLVNGLNTNGKTPLLKALKIDNHYAVELLLKHGANPNVAHPNGSTPLMMAVHCQLSDSVELLIQAGANVNAHDVRGSTALHSATYLSKTDAVRMLLEAGAEPNVQNVDHETPLHTAMGDPSGTVCTETCDQKNVVSLLLMAHADRSIKTSVGDTALDRAKRYGYFERTYLLETGNPEAFSGPPPSHFSWRKFLYVHYTGNVEIPDWYHANESSSDEADDNEADHDDGTTDCDENLGEDSDEAGDEGSEEHWDENDDWDGDEDLHSDEDLHGDGEDMADADAEMLDV